MNNATITVPHERVTQVHQIKAAMGYSTVSETLRELVRTFAHMHRLPVSIPGVTIHAAACGIVLEIEGLHRLALSPEGARLLVQRMRERISGDIRFATIEPTHRFAVARKGTAIKFATWSEDGRDNKARTFPFDVASEIADAIEAAVKEG